MSLELDNTDKTILEMLQDDSRTAFRKIAKNLGVSEATVFIRVNKLREKGIIKRFTMLVSPELLGKGLTAFVLINADPKKLQSVLEELNKIDDVYEIHDVTGTYYAIAKVRSENRDELAKIIDAIGLINGVTSTETAIVLKSIKEETRIRLK